MRKEFNNIFEAIGKTPLIRLNSVSRQVSSAIFVKPEMLNPGGSVKDRIALQMIDAAERDGKLKPGGTIIEATAGNTGVGLALAAAVKGYRCIFVMPDKMSQEKVNLLRAYGAQVVITPTAVAPDSPESYNAVADRLAGEIADSFRPSQFDNPNNELAHYNSTGPEIWADSDGKVDIFVAGMGTAGTISGTGRYLKEKNPNITVVGADPKGSVLSGDAPCSYKVEGIGEDFIPKNFNRQVIDEMVRVTDKESFNMARRLAREEGILAGGSSGTALAAAIKFARRLREPKYIVVLLPDTGRNYINKCFSDQWMKENGFWEGELSRAQTISDCIRRKKSLIGVISVQAREKLISAVNLMQKFNISQLPVLDKEQVVGSLNEATLIKLLQDGLDFRQQEIAAVMGKPLPVLDKGTDLSEAFRLLLSTANAIIVKDNDKIHGLITRSDLVEYYIHETSREQ